MRIVTYKTAYYSFYLPVACGMVLSGIKDEAAYKLAEKICVEMGQYFQVSPGGVRALLQSTPLHQFDLRRSMDGSLVVKKSCAWATVRLFLQSTGTPFAKKISNARMPASKADSFGRISSRL